ncbi:hypothetical protein FQR65_LT18909 [Abscondita terminalis]|nr:hypothetical protein FQR65_LT18909 [Abscondita terminalis]
MLAIWIGPNLYVSVHNTKDIETILKTKEVEKGDEYKYLKPWLGEGLLTSSGDKFKINKKLIMPSFHVNNLKRFMDVFNDHSLTLVENLREKVGNGEFDIDPYLSTFTMDVLLETVIGISKDTLTDQAVTYKKAIHHRLSRCSGKKILIYTIMCGVNHNFKDKVMEELNEVFGKSSSPITYNDLQKLQYLEQVIQETWRLYPPIPILVKKASCNVPLGKKILIYTIMCGINHNFKDKVMEELNEVFGKSSSPITYNDLQKLQYLEQVIQETWRLYPPIPILVKKASCNVPLDTCTLPKGCSIGLYLFGLHRDPTQYKDPHKFNPDNFLPETIKTRNPFSFLPFSAGSRTCIGAKYATMLIKVVLATLLRSYRVTSSWNESEFVISAQTVLRRTEGFPINLHFHEN